MSAALGAGTHSMTVTTESLSRHQKGAGRMKGTEQLSAGEEGAVCKLMSVLERDRRVQLVYFTLKSQNMYLQNLLNSHPQVTKGEPEVLRGGFSMSPKAHDTRKNQK